MGLIYFLIYSDIQAKNNQELKRKLLTNYENKVKKSIGSPSILDNKYI